MVSLGHLRLEATEMQMGQFVHALGQVRVPFVKRSRDDNADGFLSSGQFCE